ncbi:MAG: alpha/beta hydrolase [Chitinophagaceae bacterium]|nr:alpha/beta hydrolase [Chitinophagaceae bacterium]
MLKALTTFLLIAFLNQSFAGNTHDTTFTETTIVLHTKTGDIFGTLTTPEKFRKIPVALIIAGSGPTDRNGNGPLIKTDTYKQIAVALAQQKIATLRYDKRGIAESIASMKNEADLRFDDYVNDAREWIQLIRQDKRFSDIIVIGHSEGSLIGMLASNADVKKIVSISGAGQPVDKILREQFSTQLPFVRDAAYKILDSLKSGMMVKNVPPILQSVFRPSVQPYIISWFKYDPPVIIKNLKIPVLILQGSSDLQVKVEDATLLHAANPESELVILDSVNHVLKKVSSREENIKSYNAITLPVDEKLIIAITTFIQGN